MEYDAIEFTSYPDDTNPYIYRQSFDEKLKSWKQICIECVNVFIVMVSKPIQENFSFLLSPIVGRPITMGSTIKGSKEFTKISNQFFQLCVQRIMGLPSIK